MIRNINKGSYNYDEPQNLHEISILGVSSKLSTVTIKMLMLNLNFLNMN